MPFNIAFFSELPLIKKSHETIHAFFYVDIYEQIKKSKEKRLYKVKGKKLFTSQRKNVEKHRGDGVGG